MAKSFFSFESAQQPLASRRRFLRRVGRNIVAAGAFIGISLGVGMLGYHHFEGMEWIDAFANAAMILSGMGPLGQLQTSTGKLFAGIYALYSGLVLIVVTGIILAPIVHRVLHGFHVEAKEKSP